MKTMSSKKRKDRTPLWSKKTRLAGFPKDKKSMPRVDVDVAMTRRGLSPTQPHSKGYGR
jgi:hypothetical protein